MGYEESFKEYVQKWRDLTGRVQSPLADRELVDMFMSMLTCPFYNHLLGSSPAGFTELILTGEHVENEVVKFRWLHLQILRSNHTMVRENPMLCTIRRVVIRVTATKLWGQF